MKKRFRILDCKKADAEVEISIKTIIIIIAAAVILLGIALIIVPKLEGGAGFLKNFFRFGKFIGVLLKY